MKKLSKAGKISVFAVIGCMAMLYFLPMWQIELRAPQYPEGIGMQIHINDVKGDVDIINGLNHYIGMKTIHKEDFKEFVYLPFIIGAFMGLGLLVLIWGKKLAITAGLYCLLCSA